MRFWVFILFCTILTAALSARAQDAATAQPGDFERTLYSAMVDMKQAELDHAQKIALLRQQRNAQARARADQGSLKARPAQKETPAHDANVPYYLRGVTR